MTALESILHELDEDALVTILEHYGVDHQQAKLIEEMAELTQAIVKYNDGRDHADHVAEECADVFITLSQLALNLVPEDIAERIIYKQTRLKHRITND